MLLCNSLLFGTLCILFYHSQLISTSVNNAIVVTFVIEENAVIGSEVGRIQLEPIQNDNTKKHNKTNELTFTLQDTTYFNFDTIIVNKLIVCKLLDRDTDRKLCSESGWPEICAWSGVIFVSDGRLLSLRIVIRDINDNTPKWPTKDQSNQPVLEVWITENSPIGSRLDLPLAYDPDIGENSIVKYELAASEDDNNDEATNTSLFQIINSASPNGPIYQLIVNGILDRETLSTYHLTVAAVDGGGNRGYAKLLIHVADENDNAPIFEHCNNNNISKTEVITIGQSCEIIVNIDEDLPVGSILPVHSIATDMDEGEFGHVTYRFALSAADTARRDFKIDRETGTIIVRAPLDYDTGGLTQYIFGIVAEDGGLPPLTATTRVIINIQDKNDNPPHITITPAFLHDDNYKSLKYHQNKTMTTSTTIDSIKSSLRLLENTPPGALIATITVYDPDSDDNGKFTCQLGHTDELNLVYLRNLGKISVYQMSSLRSIDRELQPELRVSLKCEDNGTNNKQKTIELLTIHILDMNDNAPKYANKRYSFQASETNDVGILIGEVTALDPDLGLNGELNYSIHWPSGQGPNPFEINEKGELITRMPLDRENQPEGYHFIVNAYDNGEPCLSASTHVEVALIDINDCRPIFTQMNYHFSIDEELEMNYTLEPYVIGQVKATDCDIGLNAQLIYSLDTTVNNKLNHPFQVTEEGYVTTTRSIDRETHPAFLLQVLAADSAQEPEKRLTSTAQVHITILDINDNEPIFQKPPFDNGTNQVEISYNDVPGHLIAQVEAKDKDVGINGKITFSFNAKQSTNQIFMIRENTGEIFLQKELSIKDMGTIPLVILATDMGLVPKTSTATIYVKISDIPTTMFRFNSLKQHNSADHKLSTSIFANINMDANKFIIICIILITFVICTVLISVIFTISRGRCRVFNSKTTTKLTNNTYNDNPNGYLTNLVDKSSQDVCNVSLPGRSINYPFDCIDGNTFGHNTTYLPSFYDQTPSMPYTFHETGLKFYDQLIADNEQLLSGFQNAENGIQIQTSPRTNLLGNERSEPFSHNINNSNNNNNDNRKSIDETLFTSNRILTNYYPTYNSTNFYNYELNDTLPVHTSYKQSNRLYNQTSNSAAIEHSRYSGSITNLSISFPNTNTTNNNDNFNTIISKVDSSQFPSTTNKFAYGNF
ncbi:Protocadherin-11 Y-linked [Schistosoma japonicum]|uniref:Protocadherin-11 Y-linked n=1 Tax=Schistosoma japonicum TaxID=6182 RepID=A0A4Z2DD19_SCHJA|nr:Protocadherin-11 Y-linked [Schistosoma japonicum]